MLSKWDNRFLDMAKLVASWSKDPSTQVGAVIVDYNNRVVSIGYNGLPKDIIDHPNRLNDRNLKYKMIVHGEMNAILFANKSLEFCTLYTYPFMPCPRCAAMIIQTGIERVVSYNNMPERWKEEFELSQLLFKESCIQLDLYDEPEIGCGDKCKKINLS
jgi:dCMP deaminase